MNLIRLSIARPVAVLAAVLMAVLFGLVALRSIPIQLAPDVRQPIITVNTNWIGAAPAEVEREIVNRQEDTLKGLEGLRQMTSRAQDGRAEIELEFDTGQNMDRALLLVANRLNRVESYPAETDRPTLSSSGSEDTAIAWFVLVRAPGNERDIATYGDFAEETLQDRLERVPGVSRVNVYGGSERFIRVTVDPQRMAGYGLTVSEVASALRAGSAAASAGDVEEGKRRYVIRIEGELDHPDLVRGVVLRSGEDPVTGRVARVTVGDIAEVAFEYREPAARIRQLGEPALAINAIRETGANVIETMAGIRAAVDELNRTALADAGLVLEQVYDETGYINSAIDLVTQNIYVGGALAVIVLLLFLRSLRPTVIVALAIPVSVIGTFVAMAAFGRSLNVISLAGIAFAVGMVVDAAIVVQENIFRLRESGLSRAEAAYRGAAQVWGAVLASALTTVMAFVPVLVLELEAGQLFRDIAVAISVSVLLSLLVSITVIPALSRRLLHGGDASGGHRLPGLDALAGLFVRGLVGFLRGVIRSRLAALALIAAVTAGSIGLAYQYLPKLEYLPEGNRNLIFGIVLPPPGYNLETTTAIAHDLEAAIRPHWESVSGPQSAPGEPPKMARFFFVAFPSQTFIGASSTEPTRAAELIPVISAPVFAEPGTFGIITQTSLFGRGIGGGRSIDLDISGPDLDAVLAVARRAAELVDRALPRAQGNQLRPIPGLELGAPEIRIIPDRIRLADSGVSARELAETIDAFNDGMRVTEVTVGSTRMDLMLQGPLRKIVETQGIGNLPVVTASGHILPASSLADIVLTAGPTEIRHLERERTVTLEIRPAPGLALESAMQVLQREVIAALAAEGLPPGMRLDLSGTADKLTETWNAMVFDLLLALAIVYLVMAVLFESFAYPLVIMFSVPLAAAGGVAGLALLNRYVFQPLDMLTLLGFVILIGIVVNNAILLVHQTLYAIRQEGLAPAEAILAATRNRLRPIFMSTLTSVVGMAPLVAFPGPGSELYRGLGSVVIGGLSLSAALTLVIIPPLLALVVGPLEGRRARAMAPAPALGTSDG